MGAEPLVWRAKDIEWELRRTLVMGVLNVTPDSFSDGGRFTDERAAVERGIQIADEGADLIDVGGESTRPGAQPVPADEEWRRIGGVIAGVHRRSAIPISVDSRKPEVAAKALEAGAVVVNDVGGLQDPAMARLVAESGSAAVIMHMRGDPATMQADPRYDDVVAEVRAFLARQFASAVTAGVAREAIVLDPGIGFGKTPGHNVELLRGLETVRGLGRPVLVGVSRKSFLAKVHPKGDTRRLEASLATTGFAVQHGADIVRVHDVGETVRYVRMLDSLLGRG